MEDFFYAGGLPAVIEDLGDLIHRDALTVNGKTIGENVAGARCWNRDVIRPTNNPLTKEGGLAVLRGNLCPNGAVIKPSAATPELMKHRGRAVVFETIEDFHLVICSIWNVIQGYMKILGVFIIPSYIFFGVYRSFPPPI